MTSTTQPNITGCQNVNDSDGDGVIDCLDECPNDPFLQVQSTCGCQPESACRCSQSSCPPVQYQGSDPNQQGGNSNNEGSGSNITVTLIPNSTSTQVHLNSPRQTLEVTLGWGVISEVTREGQVVKSVDPISANWTRVITVNTSTITVEYISTEFVGPMWPDPNLRIQLITQISFNSQQNLSQNDTELIKFSVDITGVWGFSDDSNQLHVEFTVKAPVRQRKTCDVQQSWEVASDTPTAETFRVFLANDTATTLTFLKDCILDDEQKRTDISDPSVFSDMSGWTVTVVFPSFLDRMYYDPSFALLLGYSDENCDPLLSWILPVAFVAGAAVAIFIFVVLIYFPPTSRYLVGARTHHIQNIRNDIKRDKKLESQGQMSVNIPRTNNVVHLADDDFKVVTYEEDLENLAAKS